MTWQPLDTWILVIGVLTALSCGLLGNFLVLRRMSMMGDAISHAVLPGLAIAFLLSGSRDGLTMLAGAVVVGVLTALLVQLVHQAGRVDRLASMGVVFTSLFAIGLILIVRAADEVDLDPGCVLYGAIELAPLNTVEIAGWPVPFAALMLGVILLVDLAFVVLFYKELKITSFDPALATTLGIDANVMHYLLMALVAATTVAAFEAVGSILVVAMLIVPGATAHLLTDRLPSMLVVSAIAAAASAALGHLAAITVPPWLGLPDTSIAGSITVAAGALFTVTLLFAPRHGVVSNAIQRARLRLGILAEDVLGLLYRLEEHGVADAASRFRARVREALFVGPLSSRLALVGLTRRGLVRREPGGYRMTDRGRTRARDLVRSHRLWESYLVKQLALRPDHVHDAAMRLEHITGETMRRRLAAQTDDAKIDPHGQAIPPEEETARREERP